MCGWLCFRENSYLSSLFWYQVILVTNLVLFMIKIKEIIRAQVIRKVKSLFHVKVSSKNKIFRELNLGMEIFNKDKELRFKGHKIN